MIIFVINILSATQKQLDFLKLVRDRNRSHEPINFLGIAHFVTELRMVGMSDLWLVELRSSRKVHQPPEEIHQEPFIEEGIKIYIPSENRSDKEKQLLSWLERKWASRNPGRLKVHGLNFRVTTISHYDKIDKTPYCDYEPNPSTTVINFKPEYLVNGRNS